MESMTIDHCHHCFTRERGWRAISIRSSGGLARCADGDENKPPSSFDSDNIKSINGRRGCHDAPALSN